MELAYYNGEHSIKFGLGPIATSQSSGSSVVDHYEIINTKDTWTDFGLIPTSKPVIAPPTVKIKQIDIPGTNGVLDLTSVLTGYPMYSNRTGSLDFILAPGHGYFENVKEQVMGYLHGMTMNMYLSDDPEHYYTGMFSISSLKADARTNGITIDYNLYPFRRSLQRSDEDWLWDPFNFEDGIALNMAALVVNNTLEVIITDCVEPTSPGITPTVNMTLQHGWASPSGAASIASYSLTANTPFTSLVLKQGTNRLYFTSSSAGTVRISYRGGIL